MAYSEDLVLISKSKEDLERMLEKVKFYEKASNAKLNEKKSQMLSFGNEIIKNIGEIEQSKSNEKVRNLGFFFNHKDPFQLSRLLLIKINCYFKDVFQRDFLIFVFLKLIKTSFGLRTSIQYLLFQFLVSL